jgi:hypothetical protein
MPCNTNKPCGNTYPFSAPPEDYAACSGYSARIDRATAETYANRVGTPHTGVRGGPMCLTVASLIVGHLIYWKNKPGDCGTVTKISLGPSVGVVKGLGLASSVAGGAASIGGAVGAGTAGAFGAGAGFAGAAATAASVVGLAALPFAVWGMVNAHHKVAIAKEQATLCDVVVAANNFWDALESAMQQGKIVPDDAIAAIKQTEPQLLAAMKPIKKTSPCNAACEMEYALRAIDLYNVEVYYPSLRQAGASGIAGLIASIKGGTGGGKRIGISAGVAAGAALLV